MNKPLTQFSGEVTDVFAHRFVLNTQQGKVLADLGPKGAERLVLSPGDKLTIEGEVKPSEIKVSRISANGQPAITLEHPPKPKPKGGPKHHGPSDKADHKHPAADPQVAIHAVQSSGFEVLGVPRRKPRHFEVLGRDAEGRIAEWHVDIDGQLRKSRPVTAGDPKWLAELS